MSWLWLLSPSSGGEHVGINWWGWSEGGLGFAIVNFVLLIFLLRKIVWPKIRDGAAARHEEVRGQLDEAKRAYSDAESRLIEYESRLEKIDQEIESLLASMRREAETEKARILGAAEQQAARMRKDAEFTVGQEMKQLRIDLERELATQAAAAAEKILRERINESADRKLQEDFVTAMDSRARPS